MKCPKCQAENREGIKFCEECGARMELVCPGCGMKIPLGKNFCGECGNPLSPPSKPAPKELSFKEKFSQIQKYLPQGLTDKILAQRGRIEGERRQVTVMFCDMEGYTPLTEKLGEEEAYALMDQVYEILIHKVHDYEGTVNEMTGDGIIALFGAPIALEDAPQRAIRSALAIHREITRFSDRMMQEKGIPIIKMRAGIHRGPVVVGTLGNDLRVEFKAVGDTVNLASRMEGLAEPGTTYVTEDTFKLTEGFFRFEALGEKTIKGKDTPVRVYQVIAPSTRRTRFDVSAERGLTPFVGRGRELELLLDGLERSKGGRGQAFSIVAEAGVGKSRLLYEFRKIVANEDVTFLEGKCLSYGRGVAYHPIIDILKSNFEIREEDGDLDIREKAANGLKVLKADLASTLPYLLELLSVKESGIDSILISPEGKKDQIIEALKRIVLKGSEIRPLIMAIEDLHWLDKSSEELLKHLLDSIPGARVLLIFTYRPEFVHTWGAKSFHNQLTLNRLSNRESLAMVTHLLGMEDIEKDLEELILEKTEGVPFFIEEFVKSLKDLKMIERQETRYRLAKDIKAVTIPSTIQDVITARVDLLPEATKEVIQGGSVIEREFSYELIKEVMGLPEKELLSHLSILKDSELLYERGIFPQSSYIFKHSLTREVVYDSIMGRKKKRLHEQIGKAIEKLYPDKMDEHYGVLGEHFIASENLEKGAEYLKLAARKARKAGSYKEAIEHAKKRVLCLECLPVNPENQKKVIDARSALGDYFMTLNRHVEARDAVAPVFDLIVQLNIQKTLPGVYTALGSHAFSVEEDYSKGFDYLIEGVKSSEKTGSLFYLWQACYFLGLSLSWNCEFEKGLEYFERSLKLSEMGGNLGGIAFVKGTMSAHNYGLRGKNDLAYKLSKESLQAANESGDSYNKGMAYSSYGTSCYFKGLFSEAENAFLQGSSICEKTGHDPWLVWSNCLLGFMGSEMGEYNKSLNYHQKSISTQKLDKLYPSLVNLQNLCLEKLKVLNNDRNIQLAELTKYCEKNKLKFFEGTVARFIGEIFLKIDDQHMSEAQDWIEKSIAIDEKNGTFWFLGRDHALYSDFFKRKDDKPKAKEHLVKAIDVLKECGADGWVEKYEREMADIL